MNVTVGLVVAWLALVTIVGVNAAAAGVAAFLHGWRKTSRRGMRTLVASAFAGFLPASTMVGFVIVGSSESDSVRELGALLLVFAISFAISTLVALPGALIVSRRLEAPGDEYRAFE